MKYNLKRFIAICLTKTISLWLMSPLAAAHDLASLYQLAKVHDTALNQARETEKSELEVLPQARANLLPTIQASASNTYNRDDAQRLRYNTHSYQVALEQQLFNLASWLNYRQATDRVRLAIVTLANAEQEMILRLTGQYFAILQSQDDLNFAKAERKAFARHLEQTQQRFQVGLIAITDVHEAQAKHDNAYAQEIAAENVLRDQKEIMRQMVGEQVDSIKILKTNVKLPPPLPANMEHWVDIALKQNFKIKIAEQGTIIARKSINISRAAHWPTLALQGSVSRSQGAQSRTAADVVNKPQSGKGSAVGVNLTVPIWSGGAITSRTRQASHQYQAAMQEFESKTREVKSETRRSYRGILTKISQVNALKQAVKSSSSALEATQAAFEVGTRTIVEVLNSESDLLNAKRNFLRARYEYILESMKLKQAAGILGEDDLFALNNWLIDVSQGNKNYFNKHNKSGKRKATKTKSSKNSKTINNSKDTSSS